MPSTLRECPSRNLPPRPCSPFLGAGEFLVRSKNQENTSTLTDTQERIRTPKPRPRKLCDLDSHIIPLDRHQIYRLRHLSPQNRGGSSIDEIMSQHLGHERERAGRAQVALYHLQQRLPLPLTVPV